MMTSFGGTWYEGDDVVSNVIFHVSNIPLFVPYIWLYMYYTGTGQVMWIFKKKLFTKYQLWWVLDCVYDSRFMKNRTNLMNG